MSRVVAHLRANPIVAILRGVPAEHIVPLGQALHAGGITSMEVAFTDADAAEKIAALVAAIGDDVGRSTDEESHGNVLIGAGTVTTLERAANAIAAGASFIVTPHVAASVIAYGHEHGIPVICGATTATEVALAQELGAALIKLFPAGQLGPGYLRALLGPFPDAAMLAVGGISLANAREFLEAGALGLGIGASLTAVDRSSPDFEAVSAKGRELVDLVESVRRANEYLPRQPW